jgi:hypothetical protein
MERFGESLNHIIHRNTNGKQYNEAVMLSYESLTASLKIFALHKPHIENEKLRLNSSKKSEKGRLNQLLWNALTRNIGNNLIKFNLVFNACKMET